MTNTRIYQKGFSVVETLLVLLIIGIISWAGYYVWSASQNSKDTLGNIDASEVKTGKTTKINESKTIGVFENSKLGLKFTYPEKWGNLNDPGDVSIDDKSKFKQGFGGGPGMLTWDERDETMFSGQYDENGSLDPDTKEAVTTTSTIENSGVKLAAANSVTKIYLAQGKGAFNCGTYLVMFPVKDKIMTIRVGGCGDPAEDDPEQMADTKDPYRFSDFDNDISALLASIEIKQ